MFPLFCAVIKLLFHKHHCSIDLNFAGIQTVKKNVFLMQCLECFEVAERPIFFPIMKNQSFPDRCDFIQYGFTGNAFWWPLSSCPLHAEMRLHHQSLDYLKLHLHPPSHDSSTAQCQSEGFRTYTLQIHTVNWWNTKCRFILSCTTCWLPVNPLTGGSQMTLVHCAV